MLHPKRSTISFPISNVTMNQKPQNHTNKNNMCENKNMNNIEDESGMCSPPLWKQKSNNNNNNNYRNLSPESKTQAIERGQRELMEMVKNMPESSYELTLKDLVQEHRHNHEENRVINKDHHRNNHKLMSNKNSGKRSEGNVDSGGFYLKMVFPISLGSKKQYSYNKKKNKSDHNGSMKRSGSSGSGSGSRRSNSSNRHEVSGSGCWPFLRRSEILSHK